MRILGIDPGYGIVGYGIIETDSYKTTLIDYGVIETPNNQRLPQRLNTIRDGINYIIDKFSPEVVAIEELFFFRNYTTVIPVAEARGVIVQACYEKKIDIFEYTPLQIKQALTGNGRADKKQIQFMVKSIMGLEKVPKPDDAADAVAVAITHSQINPRLNTNQM